MTEIKYSKEINEFIDEAHDPAMEREEWMDDGDWEMYIEKTSEFFSVFRAPEYMQIMSNQIQTAVDKGISLEQQMKAIREVNELMFKTMRKKHKVIAEALKDIQKKKPHTIEFPSGIKAIHFGTDEEHEKHESIISKRHNFSLQYAIEQGWLKTGEGLDTLSLKQIMEIREQEEWKNPLGKDK